MNNSDKILPVLKTPKEVSKEKICPNKPIRKRRSIINENSMLFPIQFPNMEDDCDVNLYNKSLDNIRNFLENLGESKKEDEIKRLKEALSEL